MICKKGEKVERYYQFENVSVKLVDTSSNTERKEKLVKPLQRFFKEVERERNEKKVKAVGATNIRDHLCN